MSISFLYFESKVSLCKLEKTLIVKTILSLEEESILILSILSKGANLIIVVDPIKILKPSALMPGEEMIEKSKTIDASAKRKSSVDLEENL